MREFILRPPFIYKVPFLIVLHEIGSNVKGNRWCKRYRSLSLLQLMRLPCRWPHCVLHIWIMIHDTHITWSSYPLCVRVSTRICVLYVCITRPDSLKPLSRNTSNFLHFFRTRCPLFVTKYHREALFLHTFIPFVLPLDSPSFLQSDENLVASNAFYYPHTRRSRRKSISLGNRYPSRWKKKKKYTPRNDPMYLNVYRSSVSSKFNFHRIYTVCDYPSFFV